MANITINMNLLKKDGISGQTAGKESQWILSKLMMPSTKAFFDKLVFKNGMSGLDASCENGGSTLESLNLFGQQKELPIENKNVRFQKVNFSEWQANPAYDFIYSKLMLSQTTTPERLLTKMYDSLVPGGFLMLEEIDLTGFHCFPFCFAFNRYLELLKAIKSKMGADTKIGPKLMHFLQNTGFQKIKVQLVSPSFLKNDEKRIVSLSLENISATILNENLATATELQALLYELKSFEKQKNTMVSLPSIYQVVGNKP